jgi:hypothetical protein
MMEFISSTPLSVVDGIVTPTRRADSPTALKFTLDIDASGNFPGGFVADPS